MLKPQHSTFRVVSANFQVTESTVYELYSAFKLCNNMHETSLNCMYMYKQQIKIADYLMVVDILKPLSHSNLSFSI